MREPPPRRSKFSKFYINGDDVDYNMKSPLNGKNGYPCHNTNAGPTQGTLVAGQDLKVFFDGTATKQGGDCQFSISYDNGTSFAVIWDKLGNCFLDTVNGGYEVPVPEKLPAAKSAIFAWSWIPASGDRSYYMNCADVRVENYGKQQAYTGKELLVVNVPGKETLAPAKYPDKDTLPNMLDARPLITVGDPVEPAGGNGAESSSDGGGDDSSVNEQESGEADESNPGTVVLYVSESTTTSTQVVYISEFITDEITSRQALYTYGAGIQTKGQLSTTLGPYAKPLYGSNVGLTIANADPTDTSDTLAGGLSFTGDWASSKPTGSAKWLGSESLDYIPPSIGAPATKSTTSAKSADILLLGSRTSSASGASAWLPDATFAAGTPLFATPGKQTPTAASGFTDPTLGPAETSGMVKSNTVLTNRPDFKSVTDQANLNLINHLHPDQSDANAPHATTILSTVTKDGKPMLQVVVSMQNTPIPSSLTLSF
ncbi:hypothetical protein LPJ73_003882 [Coemansia sp. RSA 2703]|nr:hypothetical protein LPJ73_003882 [Coemansia sp. RSA 2703]KAJ2370021.1 hypothetical protein IW150_005011 [Coemansia sp. RSA 2607]